MKENKKAVPTAIKRGLLISGAFVLGSQTCLLAATSFDSLSFKPASDQGYYLTVQQSQTLKNHGFAIGGSGEFSNNSFVLKDTSGATVQDVIKKQVSATVGASFGLLDWLNVGGTVSGVPYQQFIAPGTGTSDNGARMGDVGVNLKARLLDNDVFPIGIALVPFMTIPTGNSNHYAGNGKITGGGIVVLDTKRIGDRVSFSVNAGSQFRHEVTLAPTSRTIGHQFLYGGGMNVALAKPVQAIAEVNGSTTFDNFFGSHNRDIEINGGTRFLPGGDDNSVAFTVGGGAGLMKDMPGAPDWRVFSTISYHRPNKKDLAPVAEAASAPIKEEVITTNQIHFAFGKAVIRPESYRILEGILSNIKVRPEVETVRVEGHTDSVGSDEANQKLSEKRANSVRTFLVNRGYPPEKIMAVGMGETAPIDDNDTKEGRAENRRVEFHLQLQSGAHVKVNKEKTAPTFEEGDTSDSVRGKRHSNSY
ncbi:MAG: OmpA family protein [Deltaproteobacteria bacterium]|nr:MAG: OmpA family protein [Deltaproteobacteria bacterium]